MSLTPSTDLKTYIRAIPDYPKPGIMFRDITSLLADPIGFNLAVEQLAQPFDQANVDYVAGIEARGFILGGAVAIRLGCGFIPIRKKGKLPKATVSQDYVLEYGVDTIEIHADAFAPKSRVLIIDDLIATGGTAAAAIDLIRKTKGEVVATAFVIDLPDLKGSERLRQKDVDVHTLVRYEGH